jgi:hypothetical protein
MTLPSVALGFLIASASAFLFHFIRGGRLSRLIVYLLSAWVLFFAGHGLGEVTHWRLWRVGTLNLASALLVTFLGLVLVNVLMGPTPPAPPRRPLRRPPRRPRP